MSHFGARTGLARRLQETRNLRSQCRQFAAQPAAHVASQIFQFARDVVHRTQFFFTGPSDIEFAGERVIVAAIIARRAQVARLLVSQTGLLPARALVVADALFEFLQRSVEVLERRGCAACASGIHRVEIGPSAVHLGAHCLSGVSTLGCLPPASAAALMRTQLRKRGRPIVWRKTLRYEKLENHGVPSSRTIPRTW
jgi:hypothetical protein